MTAVKEVAAARAAGDMSPCAARAAIRLPAPHWSSTAGRRVPSGQRSPAAMTATRSAGSASRRRSSHSAAACRFRRLTPMTSVVVPASRELMVDPFGEGRTRRGSRDAARLLGETDLAVASLRSPHCQHCVTLGGESGSGFIVPLVGVYERASVCGDGKRGGEAEYVDDCSNVTAWADRFRSTDRHRRLHQVIMT